MELCTRQYNKDLIIKEPIKCQDRSGGEKRTNGKSTREAQAEIMHVPKCVMKKDSGSLDSDQNGGKTKKMVPGGHSLKRA